MAMFLKCNRTGNLLFSTKEAERHAADTGFQDFAQVAPDAPVFVVADGRKLKLFWEMEEFTRFKQRTRADDLEAEPMSVSEYKQRLDSLESTAAAAAGDAAAASADAAPMDVEGSEVAAAGAGGDAALVQGAAAAAASQGGGGETVADQAIAMLPGAEALQEDGVSDGQTRMIRALDEAGNHVAEVWKWSAKAGQWSKHKQVVDEDQPAPPEDQEKALAAAQPELATQLMAMGFAEYRCKKALLLTGNDSVEHGIQWLTEHVDDPGADGPLTIAQVKAALKPKLTPEERAAKAAELQKRAQEKRKQRDAAEAVAKEKAQREAGKKTTEQMRKMQEIEQQRFIEAKKREKAELKAEKERMREKLNADRVARGFAPLEAKADAPVRMGEGDIRKAGVPTAKMRNELRGIKNEHPERKDVAFKTLLAYMTNLFENPTNPKFRRIKKENKAFATRIRTCGERGTNFLALVGFEDDGGEFLVCQGGSAADEASWEAEVMPRVKAAKLELEKSISNPFWL